MTLTAIIISIVCLVAGLVIGFLLSKSSLNSKAKFIVKDAKKTAENIIENANVKAEAIKKEKEAQAKVKFLELKFQHDENIQSREKKMQEAEKRIRDKEQKLNDELSKTGKLEKDLQRQVADYEKKTEIMQRKQQELDVATAQKVEMLEKISNYSAEEAKNELVESMKAEAKTKASSKQLSYTAEDIEVLEGVKVIVRVDFNVPIKNGVVVEDFRIKSAFPTIEYLQSKGAKVILIGHLEANEASDNTFKVVADHINNKLARNYHCETTLSIYRLLTSGSVH